MGRHIGQPGSPEQVVFLFTGWKLRGFLSDPPSKRCDTILKGFCLIETTPLHRASPQFEGGGSVQYSLSTDGCRRSGGDIPHVGIARHSKQATAKTKLGCFMPAHVRFGSKCEELWLSKTGPIYPNKL